MSKTLISIDAYMKQLNDELKRHSMYEEGMEFILYPDGSSSNDATGYVLNGGLRKIPVFVEVEHRVASKYKIIV